MYICIYVYMYKYMVTWLFIHVPLHIHWYTHICMYTYFIIRIYMYIYMYKPYGWCYYNQFSDQRSRRNIPSLCSTKQMRQKHVAVKIPKGTLDCRVSDLLWGSAFSSGRKMFSRAGKISSACSRKRFSSQSERGSCSWSRSRSPPCPRWKCSSWLERWSCSWAGGNICLITSS